MGGGKQGLGMQFSVIEYLLNMTRSWFHTYKQNKTKTAADGHTHLDNNNKNRLPNQKMTKDLEHFSKESQQKTNKHLKRSWSWADVMASMGKGACHHVWWPEFNLLDLCKK